MDEDKIELLERRLTEKVTERVRPALFRVYASMGAIVIAILGFVSWDIVSDIKSEIKNDIQKSIAEDIKKKREEILTLVAESKLLAKRAKTTISKLDKQIQEFDPHAEQLRETILKVNSLNIDGKNIVAMYSTEVKPLTDNFVVLSNQLKDLAEQVNQLNIIAETQGNSQSILSVDTTETRGAAISSVIAETSGIEQKFKERNRVTVFFQFANAHRSQAEELSSSLKRGGYNVPGVDREPGAEGKHEVRYFHEADKKAANKLAIDTTNFLKNKGYPDVELTKIKTVPFVSYKKKKPREGVIELWVHLPNLQH